LIDLLADVFKGKSRRGGHELKQDGSSIIIEGSVEAAVKK
jgi:hypothetical protein